MDSQKHSQYFKLFFLWLSIAIMSLFFFSCYVKAEMLTSIYTSQISDIDSLCQKKDANLKYFKIMQYEKQRKDLVLHCVYEDGHQNSETTANLIGQKWEKVRVNKLSERAGLYWPIYL
jgi:hypothetical protein